MERPINRLVIAGGGSAGFIAALSFRVLLPQVQVVVVHSADIPVIGVGESTTQAFVEYFHQILRIDRGEFLREVKPTWKLGLRMEWGNPDQTHFNYPFEHFLADTVQNLPKVKAFYCLEDMHDSNHYGALMDRGLAPCALRQGRVAVDPRATYHIPNQRFIDYLQRKVQALGAEVVDGEIVKVDRYESGDVKSLGLKDGREIEGDFFVDCSGFRSLLLEETMGARVVPYSDTLLCDSAVIGSWQRPEEDTDIHPYTTAETMNHGWCWRIDFLDVVTRGYVFSSEYCAPEEAMRELQESNPRLGDDLRLLKFPSGRYDRYWIGNVAGVGNASGFVEPLEATALHLIILQSWNLVAAIRDSDRCPSEMHREIENRRYESAWDDVRDFLALHYRFNRRLDTPFWQYCREHTPLGEAEELVAAYAEIGPAVSLNALIRPHSIFGHSGFVNLLVGQHVPTRVRTRMNEYELQQWQAHCERVRSAIRPAMPVKDALLRVYDECRHWPREGI